MHFAFGFLLLFMSVFLILLVLVQRGRGGGLAGAFGGMGGQSAFGAKAGDLFTRITIVAVGIWIVLCCASILVLNKEDELFSRGGDSGGRSSMSAPADTDSADDNNAGADAGTGAGSDEPTGDSGAAGAAPSDADATGGDAPSGDAQPATGSADEPSN